ncbi:hypothetical protein B0F90DRAFT_124131 [Multifurca ochricompacta]|uniref:Alcohol acetyltransferase n=1 Tax=Multifurca ochricompacta TaxID=376703 RepID=A0AAD4MH12_9AGAM|nr:hypothetical protein B0F90DRAFT_124131 [Multifurca ochricompacta]
MTTMTLTVDTSSSLAVNLPSPELTDEDIDSAPNPANREHMTTSDSSAPDCCLQHPEPVHYERKLGDSELSYYLPGRATGVNDMYLHLGFRSPERIMLCPRVCAVWAIMRMRHPLLASKIVMRDYDDVRFVYVPSRVETNADPIMPRIPYSLRRTANRFHPPPSPEEALAEAGSQLEYRQQSKDDLIESYLNGPRTLSNERLFYLVVSRTPVLDTQLPTPPTTPRTFNGPPVEILEHLTGSDDSVNYELLICAAHSIGDGMALHQFANDFYSLLGSDNSQKEMEALVADEWNRRWGRPLPSGTPALPASVEENLGTDQNRFRRAAGCIDFQISMDKQIGGQAFPRRTDPVRHTVVPTTSFDENLTRTMLKKCKAQGVSISSAIFAICSIAWARMSPREKQKSPMMMYAAMNIRPYFPKPAHESYWFLAVGYFNIVLPNFIPTSCDVSKTFWLRARKAKEQSSRVASSSMIQSRNREMAIKRGKQSRSWAKEDDEKEAGLWAPPPPTSDKPPPPSNPSVALLGLSLLGNLDGIYKHANFPDIKLHTLTTGSRQRHSGMLLFGYTFAGKLWISLGYDENGFDRETVDLFLANVNTAAHEFLIQ